MAKRRSRGDGGLHWDEKRQRWIATASLGFAPNGKRIVKRGSGKTKTKAKEKLKEILRDHEDGLAPAPRFYRVRDAVSYWLDHGLAGRGDNTMKLYRDLATNHVIPGLGARNLVELSVEDVDGWLKEKSKTLSTRTLKMLRDILNRSVKNAMARDKVKRNVVELCGAPEGQPGRDSKALDLKQAEALLDMADVSPLRIRAYITVSLLSGVRTDEIRALPWEHVVAYDEASGSWRSIKEVGWDHEQFAVYVWRAERKKGVRKEGDTKTQKSRRSFGLSKRCVVALRLLWEAQNGKYELVIVTENGTPMSATNVRRDFRKVVNKAGLNGDEWTPRELRHSFVSLLSDHEIPIEAISRLVGHSSSEVTERVYRHQIRPVIQTGAAAMDAIFPTRDEP